MTPIQFEEHTQSLYRLRSARNKRRSLIDDRDKQLLELSRERLKLWQEQRNQPWEPIDPPYQRGWKRSFVLRDDVAESPAAALYGDILKRINTTQLSTRQDFMRKKRRHSRKIHVARSQELKALSPWDWHRAALDPKQASLFERREFQHDRQTEYPYVFTEPWRFQLCVEKNMITQLQKPLSQVEGRLQRISNLLNSQDLGLRMQWLNDGTARSYRQGKAAARNAMQKKPSTKARCIDSSTMPLICQSRNLKTTLCSSQSRSPAAPLRTWVICFTSTRQSCRKWLSKAASRTSSTPKPAMIAAPARCCWTLIPLP